MYIHERASNMFFCFFFEKLPSYTSATDLTKVLNWCLWLTLFIETILSLKISNVMSGEHIEVKNKNVFFGLLNSCLVWTIYRLNFNLVSSWEDSKDPHLMTGEIARQIVGVLFGISTFVGIFHCCQNMSSTSAYQLKSDLVEPVGSYFYW